MGPLGTDRSPATRAAAMERLMEVRPVAGERTGDVSRVLAQIVGFDVRHLDEKVRGFNGIRCPVGPFERDHRASIIEEFLPTERLEFIRVSHPVGIDVNEAKPITATFMLMDDRESRTGHHHRVDSHSVGDPTREGGFTSPKLTLEGDAFTPNAR
jgi:hypothetical protein